MERRARTRAIPRARTVALSGDGRARARRGRWPAESRRREERRADRACVSRSRRVSYIDVTGV
jgi:hypothetical protein